MHRALREQIAGFAIERDLIGLDVGFGFLALPQRRVARELEHRRVPASVGELALMPFTG